VGGVKRKTDPNLARRGKEGCAEKTGKKRGKLGGWSAVVPRSEKRKEKDRGEKSLRLRRVIDTNETYLTRKVRLPIEERGEKVGKYREGTVRL